jgi:hypothetical protein
MALNVMLVPLSAVALKRIGSAPHLEGPTPSRKVRVEGKCGVESEE